MTRVKQAKLKDYVKNKGSDGETSSEVEDADESRAAKNDAYSAIDDEELLDREEIGNQLMKMKKKMNSAKNMRQFLQGIQLYVRVKGLKLNVFSPSRQIIFNRKIKPNFSLDVDGFNMFLSCLDD